MPTRRQVLCAAVSLPYSAVAATTAAKDDFKSDGSTPRQSPEYAVLLPDGKQILVSSYKGKVLAIEFLLTTCPHCQRTAAVMQKLYQQNRLQGFEVLGVAIDTENGQAARNLPKFIKDQQLAFPVGFAPNREGVYDYLQRSFMDRLLMPQMVWLDRKGVIQVQFAGDNPVFQEPQETHLGAVLSKMMKPAAAPAAPVSGAKSRKSK